MDNGIALKVAIFTILVTILSLLLFFGVRLERDHLVCNRQNQDSLDTLMTQSQTVLADRYDICTSSYQLLTDWDMCLSSGERRVPERLRTVVIPVVSNMMMFLREKQKDIVIMKKEHDERCSDYRELLFYSPEYE